MIVEDWKTTLTGTVAAGCQLYAGGGSWKTCLFASVTFLLGVLAKDPKFQKWIKE